MSQSGADLEHLAALRAALFHESQVLEQVAATVRHQLGNTVWSGPAADRFRAAWTSDFEPSLRGLQGALEEAGTEVGRRLEALVQASR